MSHNSKNTKCHQNLFSHRNNHCCCTCPTPVHAEPREETVADEDICPHPLHQFMKLPKSKCKVPPCLCHSERVCPVSDVPFSPTPQDIPEGEWRERYHKAYFKNSLQRTDWDAIERFIEIELTRAEKQATQAERKIWLDAEKETIERAEQRGADRAMLSSMQGREARHATLAILREKVEAKMKYYQEQSKISLDDDCVMVAYDFDSRYVALKHLLDELDNNTP